LLCSFFPPSLSPSFFYFLFFKDDLKRDDGRQSCIQNGILSGFDEQGPGLGGHILTRRRRRRRREFAATKAANLAKRERKTRAVTAYLRDMSVGCGAVAAAARL
jgi:hypothetical protein